VHRNMKILLPSDQAWGVKVDENTDYGNSGASLSFVSLDKVLQGAKVLRGRKPQGFNVLPHSKNEVRLLILPPLILVSPLDDKVLLDPSTLTISKE